MSTLTSQYQLKQTPGKKTVLPYVLADLQERAETERKKHGTYLQTMNKRDALWETYQGILDAAIYLRQLILEREANTLDNF